MYFGYTFCPDVCPTGLQICRRGLRAFEQADPARGGEGRADLRHRRSGARHAGGDEELRRRLPPAHGRADRHDGARSRRVAKAYGVYAARGKEPGRAAAIWSITVAQAYLMDPDGKPIALLPSERAAGQGRRRTGAMGEMRSHRRTTVSGNGRSSSSTARNGRRCATAAANAASTSWRTRTPASWSRPTSPAGCSTGGWGGVRTTSTATPMSPNACG